MTDEGSLFKVPLTQIKRIRAHPNADALDIATIYGFDVVVKKNLYKAGDKYILPSA